MKLQIVTGDGDIVLLSETLATARGVLRWLAKLGDPDLREQCAALADRVAAEERRAATLLRQTQTTAQAREGQRGHGEPVVILKAGLLEKSCIREGEELSLAEVDRYLEFKYCAAQMALQRGRKDGSLVGILFKDKCGYSADEMERDGNKEAEKESSVAREVRFCRVSDLDQVFEKYPEAASRWNKNKAREEFDKLPAEEQKKIRDAEDAAFRAERDAKFAAEGGAQ